MNKITMIKNSLTDCIKNMSVEKERFVRNPLKDFIRNSKCNIETTTRIILGFEDQCLNSELKNYYRMNDIRSDTTVVIQKLPQHNSLEF